MAGFSMSASLHGIHACCLVALAGCSAGGAGTHADGGSAPGSGAQDGSAWSDLGTATSDLAPTGPRCPAYVGSTRVGAQWVYSVIDGDTSFTETVVVTAANATASALELTLRTTSIGSDSKGDSYNWTIVTQARCDATGYLAISYRVDNHNVLGGVPDNSWSQWTYSPLLLSMAADLHATPSWSWTGTLSQQNSAGNNTSTAYTYSFTVGNKSSVTVPAGTFDVIPITTTVTSNTTTSSTTYYAAGVGDVSLTIPSVASYSSKLVSYTP
jgi:hypothetical protein